MRGLLSPSRDDTKSKSNTPPVVFPGVPHEEELFAFSPFELDKPANGPNALYCTNAALNIERVASVIPTEPILSNLQPETPANAPPFSTPGCFASVRRSIADGMFQKALVPQQVTSRAANMMLPQALPPSHLCLDDEIEGPQTASRFSHLVPSDNPPSDFQEHEYINHVSQVPGGNDDSLNVYATPGPTFTCSRPVYFDSPTEDPSLSDPLHPESYELDLNAINFRWRPFLRSNLQEWDLDRHSILPISPLRHAIPNLAGDQNGQDTRFVVDHAKYGASSEDLPSLEEDTEVTYLVDAMQPSNVNATRLSTIGRGSSLINDVPPRMSMPVSDALLSPLPESALLAVNSVQPCGHEEDMCTSEVLALVSV